ncbi:MAG: hypothetical protein ACRCS9_13145 [Hyphomicrobium sp.]
MYGHALEQVLIERLGSLTEVELSGFSVRTGLTGAGVTVLRGGTYFGSWRVTAGTLVWNHAHMTQSNYFAKDVDDALRHTMILILRSLETRRLLRAS